MPAKPRARRGMEVLRYTAPPTEAASMWLASPTNSCTAAPPGPSLSSTISTAPESPGPLLMDPSGNLFGTARAGGLYDGGLIYKLPAKTWKQTILHNFCKEANCTDGQQPVRRLLMDASGNLFGTTEEGGPNEGGVLYERTSGGSYKILHNFGYNNGAAPFAGLLMDASGNLFGTTFLG